MNIADKVNAIYSATYGEVKKELDKGKLLISSAITEKGIDTNIDDTFEKMASNIKNLDVTKVIKVYTINNRSYESWYPTETVNIKSILPNNYRSLSSSNFILNAHKMVVRTVASCEESWNYSFSYNPNTGILTINNPLYYVSGHGYYQLSSFDIYVIIN